MIEDKKNAGHPPVMRPHTISIDNRKRAHLTGVTKVVSATTTRLSLETALGGLVIEGIDLNIGKYSDTEGTLGFEGNVSGLRYTKGATSLVKKIFK